MSSLPLSTSNVLESSANPISNRHSVAVLTGSEKQAFETKEKASSSRIITNDTNTDTAVSPTMDDNTRDTKPSLVCNLPSISMLLNYENSQSYLGQKQALQFPQQHQQLPQSNSSSHTRPINNSSGQQKRHPTNSTQSSSATSPSLVHSTGFASPPPPHQQQSLAPEPKIRQDYFNMTRENPDQMDALRHLASIITQNASSSSTNPVSHVPPNTRQYQQQSLTNSFSSGLVSSSASSAGPTPPLHHLSSVISNSKQQETREQMEERARRKRRKFDEIERKYHCTWKNCTKSYGTLNHLNHHISLQKHGVKRHAQEFRNSHKQKEEKGKNSAGSETSEDYESESKLEDEQETPEKDQILAQETLNQPRNHVDFLEAIFQIATSLEKNKQD